MKDHPHCYHINFACETETCCCSDSRKLRFGQGYFDLDVATATPLLSVWWWRYNPKMYGMYHLIKRFLAHPGPRMDRMAFTTVCLSSTPTKGHAR